MVHGTSPNPLRRPADRTRARWLVGLGLSVLFAVLSAVASGLAVWDADSRTARSEAERLHQITATTTGAAEHAPDAWTGGGTEAVAQAVWEFPAATRRAGLVEVPPGTPAGRPVAIWVDDAGGTARGPRSEAEGAFAAITVGGTAAALIALTAAAVVHLRLRTVEAHSLSVWERDWKRVEPEWSGRLPTESGADDD